MKAYKVEILIIDLDGIGSEGIREEIESTRYANDCISPNVMSIEEREIGEWHDEHPFNKTDTFQDAYNETFN